MKINSEQVSFVVQGPVLEQNGANLTVSAIKSIKKNFPGAKIVLSTWIGANHHGIPFDSLVESPDPGSYLLQGGSTAKDNNLNRQIVSSRNGLAVVTTPYAVKTRSDVEFKNSRLLDYLAFASTSRPKKLPLFKRKVVVLDRLTIDPRKEMRLQMHPCDWISAGLTEDVKLLWARNLMSEKDAFYFRESSEDEFFPRYRPEAHIWVDLLKELGYKTPSSTVDQSIEFTELTIGTFSNNLLPVSQAQVGVKSKKNPKGFDLGRVMACYTALDLNRDLKEENRGLPFKLFGFEIAKLEGWRRLVRIKALALDFLGARGALVRSERF